jgi:hypothetical protein
VPDRLDFTIVAATRSVAFTVPVASGPGYEGLARRYRLYHSTDLDDWTPVSGVEGIADGSTLTHPIPAGETRGFYRFGLDIE